MGGRQSKRSVDITTTPKKDALPMEAGSDAAALSDGKLEKIEELKPTTNGTAVHTEAPTELSEDKDKDSTTEKVKEEILEKVSIYCLYA